MPSTLFDSAGLAVVAYVQVDASGHSNSTALANSGVSTTRTGAGSYLIVVPTALGQDPSRDLIFVQPTSSTGNITYPPGTIVTDQDDYVKSVLIGTLDPTTHVTTALDCDFNLPLQQGQGNHNSGPNWRRDLIIVTPTGSGPLMVGTDDQSDFVKQVYLSNNAGLVNSDFAIIIFRSTIPTPTDSNGDQDGPV